MTATTMREMVAWASETRPIGPRRNDAAQTRFDVSDDVVAVIEEPPRVQRPPVSLAFVLSGLLIALGLPTVAALVAMLTPELLFRVEQLMASRRAPLVRCRISRESVTVAGTSTLPWRRVQTVAAATSSSGHGVWVTPEDGEPQLLVEFAEYDEAATLADLLRTLTR